MSRESLEAAKTVMEVAEIAWTAVECCHHHHHNHHGTNQSLLKTKEGGLSDVGAICFENQRLRQLLEENMTLLQQISSSPTALQNCPSDLHDRLLQSVNSESFLNELKSLQEKSTCKIPFDEPSDLEKAGDSVNIGQEEPSWWVWVPREMFAGKIEEKSEIDNENYVVISEEDVVDGVANFMARCILANPNAKKLTPMELQKTLMKALEGMNKAGKMLHIWHAGMMFYTLATWGLALASLYQGRAILKLAARGVHHSSKLALKAL